MAYLYLNKMPVSEIIALTVIASEAITNCTGYIRQAVAEMIDLESVVIGGVDVIIEVDEQISEKESITRTSIG